MHCVRPPVSGVAAKLAAQLTVERRRGGLPSAWSPPRWFPFRSPVDDGTDEHFGCVGVLSVDQVGHTRTLSGNDGRGSPFIFRLFSLSYFQGRQ